MKKLVFIDRDGTMIKEAPPTYQIDSYEKLEFYPEAIPYLARIAAEMDYELVLVTNQEAGSDGDIVNAVSQAMGIGPVIGTRTWGGLVGTLNIPATIDGGGITAPSLAFYNLKGEWDVENIGVAPASTSSLFT